MHRLLAIFVLVAACGRPLPLPLPTGDAPPDTTTWTDCASAWQPGHGLVVHEWGTFTNVVGSDGVLLPGLNHEEEDLPLFVADRFLQAPSGAWGDTVEKMETPVTYFYSEHALTASARVRFPDGVLTQWYPYVKHMEPTAANGVVCAPNHAASAKHGLLDWGSFQVLARDVSVALPDDARDTTWKFARAVNSNVLEMQHPGSFAPNVDPTQHERFLFYRGLGSFTLPLQLRLEGETLHATNPTAASFGGLLLMRVTKTAGRVEVMGDLAGGAQANAMVPAATLPLDQFVQQLREVLLQRLQQAGLYADEAKAMVDTWEHSYFRTPGTRLLYLLPQQFTDRLIPLEISPTPAQLLRAMVIRVELLTPADEAELRTQVERLGGPDDRAARDFFIARGRFAAPHLARAIALTNEARAKQSGEALLAAVQGTRRWKPLWSE